MNTETIRPMDQVVVKEETTNKNGEVGQAPNLQPVEEPCDTPAASPGSAQPGPAPVPSRQEEVPHATHSFEWSWGNKKPKNFTCTKAGTVEELLKRSPQFKEIAKKNKNKELVIVRDGKAISSHFPCSLIKNECLTVKYIKFVDNPKQWVRRRPSGELLEFYVLTKGDKNVKRIMKNPALTDFQEITVYAYKGEKVIRALKRDGRLLDTIFKRNIELCEKSTERATEMSDFVDNNLDGKTFKITLINKASPPESQPGSLDDAYVMQNESQGSDSDRNQDPRQPQSAATESVNDNKSKEKPTQNDMAPKNIFEIPHSQKMLRKLCSQFEDVVKVMKTQLGSKGSIQNLFRGEFGKSVETCREVKTMKELMDLSSSVCHVRTNGRAEGSGFLLFDRFVLTNGHVVKNKFNEHTGQFNERVSVHFSFESLEQSDGGQDSGVEVEELVGFEYHLDESGQEYDWALLKLCAAQKLPDGLLTRFGFLPKSGAICIIGHPDNGVKKIDPCFIVPTDNRKQVVERHCHENPQGVEVDGSDDNLPPRPIQLVTDCFFPQVLRCVELKRQVLNYETCFYFGSSGSPVFDEHCNVVAMHTGGFPYRNARGQSRSVIEYGHPLSIIIERIIVQIVKREKFDVLKEFLACSFKHRERLITSLERAFDSRNLTVFKNAVSKLVDTSDESLERFFEFPMEID